MRRVETGLDQVLALWLGDKRLKLRGRECVHQSSLRYDEQQYLRSSQSRKFISLIKRVHDASVPITRHQGMLKAHLLHDTSLALRESDVPPGLVLNKLDLDFSATGLLILRSTFFLLVVVATAVDGIVVLDEGVVADGREAVVPGVGTLTLILSRRGCDGIRHVAMEDEKGKSGKGVQRKTMRLGVRKKNRERKSTGVSILIYPLRLERRGREEEEREGAEDGGREEGPRAKETRGRWDGVGELSGTGNCSLLGDDDQVGRKKNRRSI